MISKIIWSPYQYYEFYCIGNTVYIPHKRSRNQWPKSPIYSNKIPMSRKGHRPCRHRMYLLSNFHQFCESLSSVNTFHFWPLSFIGHLTEKVSWKKSIFSASFNKIERIYLCWLSMSWMTRSDKIFSKIASET